MKNQPHNNCEAVRSPDDRTTTASWHDTPHLTRPGAAPRGGWAEWREMILGHDALDTTACESLAAHARSCPQCRNDFHALEEMGDILREEVVSEDSAVDFADAIMAKIEDERKADTRIPSIVIQTLVALIAMETAFLLGVKVKMKDPGIMGGLLDAFGVAELGYPVYDSVFSFCDSAFWLFDSSSPYTVSVNLTFIATVGTLIAVAYSMLLYFELRPSRKQ